ncbi:MAG: hypothetical protein ABIZ81_16360 [Opitutaceae bacterium]
MKKTFALTIACAVAVFTFAQDAAKKTAPSPASTKDNATPPAIPVTAAVVTAPFVLKDGVLSQPGTTELATGGKAVITFSVPKAGDYVILAVASAADEESNSFFLNIDGQPEDPLGVWDIEVTNGFEERVVGWRGTGDSTAPEFAPKVFKLTAGEHKLNLVGREPAQLKSVTIVAMTK